MKKNLDKCLPCPSNCSACTQQNETVILLIYKIDIYYFLQEEIIKCNPDGCNPNSIYAINGTCISCINNCKECELTNVTQIIFLILIILLNYLNIYLQNKILCKEDKCNQHYGPNNNRTECSPCIEYCTSCSKNSQ